MLRVSQVGGRGGGSATWGSGPNMGVFFKMSLPLGKIHLSQDNLCSCLGEIKRNYKNEYNTNGGHMDARREGGLRSCYPGG